MKQHTNIAINSEVDEYISHKAMEALAWENYRKSDTLSQEDEDVRYDYFCRGARALIKYVLDKLDIQIGNDDANPTEEYLRGFQEGAEAVRMKIYKALQIN